MYYEDVTKEKAEYNSIAIPTDIITGATYTGGVYNVVDHESRPAWGRRLESADSGNIEIRTRSGQNRIVRLTAGVAKTVFFDRIVQSGTTVTLATVEIGL